MMSQPLMPKATAVWLIENTVLTFEQIADFCDLHLLEVQGIADGDVASGIKGADPIAAGQLTRAEIEKCQKNSENRLHAVEKRGDLPKVKRRVGPKYTPLSKRQERPDAIFWLVRNHPELLDAQISRLVGTTKNTIQSIRDRTHWNSSFLNPVDPVSLGICSQVDLDKEVEKASKRNENRKKKEEKEESSATKIDSVETENVIETLVEEPNTQIPHEEKIEEKHYDADSVFSKLKELKEE
ncbi:MAG: cell cycle transcriptional regulator TrcR [Pseudomonadota bacterium]|nr:cell cycle transcriptional regulator TrcR [Pseudomonadota bacterium]